MSEETVDTQTRRDELIEELSESIVDAAKPLIDPATKEEALSQTREDISERLRFEVSVALNEIVTRYSRQLGAAVEARAERLFERFGVNFRLQHALMILSVVTLIITGLPLKFPELAISKFIIIDMFGGLQNSTLIHRIAAAGLITVGVWHLGYTLFSRFGRRDFMLMLPRLKDVKDLFHTLVFFLGKRASGPKFGRFSFIEKFDYWAVYWGMVIMIGSGSIMWFKEYFPKLWFDVAREAHSDEGLLATLAILIWHFYNAHLNPDVFPMNPVFINGKLTESEMKHHHPLEYAEIIEKERQAVDTAIESDGGEEEALA